MQSTWRVIGKTPTVLNLNAALCRQLRSSEKLAADLRFHRQPLVASAPLCDSPRFKAPPNRARDPELRARRQRHTVPLGRYQQVTVLILGFADFIAIAIVVDGTAACLQRSGLSTLADGAAVHEADFGATGAAVYEGGVPEGRLEGTAVRARQPF
jgi:hypothetical protein